MVVSHPLMWFSQTKRNETKRKTKRNETTPVFFANMGAVVATATSASAAAAAVSPSKKLSNGPSSEKIDFFAF